MRYVRPLILSFCLLSATALAAQGTSVAFGSFAQDKDLPVEVSADNLSVDQETGIAIATGNVLIGQGEMRLSAPRVRVTYSEARNSIDRMEATGGVTLVSGPDAAEAERADYSIADGVIVMTGNVLLDQGLNVMSGDRLTVQLDDGTAEMSGRVKTVLQTGGND